MGVNRDFIGLALSEWISKHSVCFLGVGVRIPVTRVNGDTDPGDIRDGGDIDGRLDVLPNDVCSWSSESAAKGFGCSCPTLPRIMRSSGDMVPLLFSDLSVL